MMVNSKCMRFFKTCLGCNIGDKLMVLLVPSCGGAALYIRLVYVPIVIWEISTRNGGFIWFYMGIYGKIMGIYGYDPLAMSNIVY